MPRSIGAGAFAEVDLSIQSEHLPWPDRTKAAESFVPNVSINAEVLGLCLRLDERAVLAGEIKEPEK